MKKDAEDAVQEPQDQFEEQYQLERQWKPAEKKDAQKDKYIARL